MTKNWLKRFLRHLMSVCPLFMHFAARHRHIYLYLQTQTHIFILIYELLHNHYKGSTVTQNKYISQNVFQSNLQTWLDWPPQEKLWLQLFIFLFRHRLHLWQSETKHNHWISFKKVMKHQLMSLSEIGGDICLNEDRKKDMLGKLWYLWTRKDHQFTVKSCFQPERQYKYLNERDLLEWKKYTNIWKSMAWISKALFFCRNCETHVIWNWALYVFGCFYCWYFDISEILG